MCTDCERISGLAIDKENLKWFSRCMKAVKMKSISEQKEIEIKQQKPVVFEGFKEWLRLMTQFVMVGGDLV